MSALAAKMMALAVLLAVTLTFGLVPLCLVQGAGPCALGPGEEAHPIVSFMSPVIFFFPLYVSLIPPVSFNATSVVSASC